MPSANAINGGTKSSSRNLVMTSSRAREAYTRMPEQKREGFPDKEPSAKVAEQKAKKAAKKDADKAKNIERGEKLLALLNIR